MLCQSFNVRNRCNTVKEKAILRVLDFNCKHILTTVPIIQEIENNMNKIDIMLINEHWFLIVKYIYDKNYINISMDLVKRLICIIPFHQIICLEVTKVAIKFDDIITPLQLGNVRIQCMKI